MIEQVAAEGKPARIWDERVDLIEAAIPYWQAFQELDGQRPMGGMGGVGEMRREAVTDWLNENVGNDPHSRARYRRLLGAMDAEFLSAIAKQSEVKAPKVGK